jgi:DNA-binding PadR family transcriptional regulator
MLRRLEAEGVLTPSEVVVDGKLRRLSRATPAGRRAFVECKGAVRKPADEVLDR